MFGHETNVKCVKEKFCVADQPYKGQVIIAWKEGGPRVLDS